jgi:nucleotide-binding universal stress UspA family protein
MAPCYHPDAIKADFENEAIRADVAFNYRIDYVHEDKQSASDKIRNKILNYAHDNNVDVLVLGSYGAKGHERSNNGIEHVGSSALEAVKNAHCTTVLIKPDTKVPDHFFGSEERASFMIGVDGSDIAHQGFLQAAHLCQRNDKLVTLTLGESIPSRSSRVPLCFRPEVIQERYTEALQEMGFGHDAVLQRCQAGLSIPAMFMKVAEERAITFLVFGSKGLSGSGAELGSVAHACVRKARCGVIVVKLSSRDLRPNEQLEDKGLAAE